MKIVIDSAIPFIEGVFEPHSEVVYIPGNQINNSHIHNADALVIRTRTRCNRELLEYSSVKHIATATIGYDHIDLDYCHKNGIEVTTAAGCNARGVLQWISAALSYLSKKEGWEPSQKTLGIVGVGNVGKLIEEYSRLWGFEVICCDPPRGEIEFVELEELLTRADIVTFHTPLDDSTFHMLNSQNIGLMKSDATIINTSRGEVIESQALLDNPSHQILLDVWECEPNINKQLVDLATIATSHIAGYSAQGKANGTAIVVNSIAQYLGFPIYGWYPNIKSNNGKKIEWREMQQTITQYIDLEEESARLKSHIDEFEKLRNNYQYREEYF